MEMFVSRTGPALGRWGNWSRGLIPHWAIVWVRRETFKAERETANLWQPKWNESQTVLATAIQALDGAVAGGWSLGIVEQSQGEGCCWLWREIEGMWGRRLWWEMLVEESWAAMEARRYCWVMHRGWSHHCGLSPFSLQPALAAEQ